MASSTSGTTTTTLPSAGTPIEDMTVEELLAQFQQAAAVASGASTELQPIGVPNGFVATPRTDLRGLSADAAGRYPATHDVAARYFEGDDWVPASLPPVQIAELQRRLVAAGLIPKGAEYRNGYWDDVTQNGFRVLLAESNASGFTYGQTLTLRESAERENRPQFQAKPFLAPDPATIRQNAREWVKSNIGDDRAVAMGDDELDRLVSVASGFDRSAYEQQTSAERAAFDAAQENTGGGGEMQSVDPVARFQEFLQEKYAPEIRSRQGTLDMANARQGLMQGVLATQQSVLS
jgi:hypothetical protein